MNENGATAQEVDQAPVSASSSGAGVPPPAGRRFAAAAAGRHMSSYRYDFEKPLAELEHRLQEARKSAERDKRSEAVKTLEAQFEQLQRKIYGQLTPWQRVQLARHPQRPYTLDYIRLLTSEFVPVHGDRLFSDDLALVGGLARFRPEGRGRRGAEADRGRPHAVRDRG